MPNGAADKPRKARKPQAFSPGVGLIRVVVRRFAPSNHADAYPPPRCRGREAPAKQVIMWFPPIYHHPLSIAIYN